MTRETRWGPSCRIGRLLLTPRRSIAPPRARWHSCPTPEKGEGNSPTTERRRRKEKGEEERRKRGLHALRPRNISHDKESVAFSPERDRHLVAFSKILTGLLTSRQPPDHMSRIHVPQVVCHLIGLARSMLDLGFKHVGGLSHLLENIAGGIRRSNYLHCCNECSCVEKWCVCSDRSRFGCYKDCGFCQCYDKPESTCYCVDVLHKCPPPCVFSPDAAAGHNY
ncbi:hypothetical protein Taro_010512 [Colocasia esculenta]|uniref:Uncharacterized protein n=1 Tax=Colocasia esculenta TaxID=4460 RepID=A0A843UD89_COLES|nr:hypothetical protein [Colocasia esculenta]